MDERWKTRCPGCGSPELLRLDLTVQNDPMVFTTCSQCETRWWERDGSAVPLRSVLSAVSGR